MQEYVKTINSRQDLKNTAVYSVNNISKVKSININSTKLQEKLKKLQVNTVNSFELIGKKKKKIISKPKEKEKEIKDVVKETEERKEIKEPKKFQKMEKNDRQNVVVNAVSSSKTPEKNRSTNNNNNSNNAITNANIKPVSKNLDKEKSEEKAEIKITKHKAESNNDRSNNTDINMVEVKNSININNTTDIKKEPTANTVKTQEASRTPDSKQKISNINSGKIKENIKNNLINNIKSAQNMNGSFRKEPEKEIEVKEISEIEDNSKGKTIETSNDNETKPIIKEKEPLKGNIKNYKKSEINVNVDVPEKKNIITPNIDYAALTIKSSVLIPKKDLDENTKKQARAMIAELLDLNIKLIQEEKELKINKQLTTKKKESIKFNLEITDNNLEKIEIKEKKKAYTKETLKQVQSEPNLANHFTNTENGDDSEYEYETVKVKKTVLKKKTKKVKKHGHKRANTIQNIEFKSIIFNNDLTDSSFEEQNKPKELITSKNKKTRSAMFDNIDLINKNFNLLTRKPNTNDENRENSSSSRNETLEDFNKRNKIMSVTGPGTESYLNAIVEESEQGKQSPNKTFKSDEVNITNYNYNKASSELKKAKIEIKPIKLDQISRDNQMLEEDKLSRTPLTNDNDNDNDLNDELVNINEDEDNNHIKSNIQIHNINNNNNNNNNANINLQQVSSNEISNQPPNKNENYEDSVPDLTLTDDKVSQEDININLKKRTKEHNDNKLKEDKNDVEEEKFTNVITPEIYYSEDYISNEIEGYREIGEKLKKMAEESKNIEQNMKIVSQNINNMATNSRHNTNN